MTDYTLTPLERQLIWELAFHAKVARSSARVLESFQTAAQSTGSEHKVSDIHNTYQCARNYWHALPSERVCFCGQCVEA